MLLVGYNRRESKSAALPGAGDLPPVVTTNCAVLGVAILLVQKEYNLGEAVVYAVAVAVGFTLALVLFAGLRERLELENVPKALRGVPIALITAGILAMAFMGFSGLVR